MKTQSQRFVWIVAALFVALVLYMALFDMQPSQVTAAVITPVTQTNRGGEEARIVEFFDNRVITADTRVCFELKDYEIVDLQYIVDAALVNTTTVTLQNTNTDPNVTAPTPVYNAANAIATVVSTDASTMVQLPLFGRWNCVLADVTNSNPITFNILAVAK